MAGHSTSVLVALVATLAGCSAAASKPAAVTTASASAGPTNIAAAGSAPTRATTEPTTADPALAYQPSMSHPVVTDDRVFLVGDSITESVGPRYSGAACHALEPLGWNVTVDAFMGRTTAEATQELRAHRSSVGQVVVILIGHNDGIDPEAYHQHLGQLLQVVPDVRRILLLTNYEFERGRDRMNQVLRDLAAGDHRVELVDWNLMVQGTTGAIQRDGLHLTTIGEQALASTIATALGPAPDTGDVRARTCLTFRNPLPSGSSGGSGGSRRTTTSVASPATSEAPPTDSGSSPSGPPSSRPAPDAPGPTTSPPKPPRTNPPKPPATNPVSVGEVRRAEPFVLGDQDRDPGSRT